YISYMGNDLFVVSDTFVVGAKVLRITCGHPYFTDCGGPQRTITQRLDLRVYDKDRVGANPIMAANRAVQQIGVSHAAEVRLGVGNERQLSPISELRLQHF